MNLSSIIVYAAAMVCSAFGVSGINFDGFIKKNHVWEARFLSTLIMFSLTYCVGSLILALIGK